ncbi:MAG: hypothetical protein J3R72DRAFT_493620 [Linnemannia gamsii]|nr:MAG: hypothetical protein J3R72DRAFT_493620 [Linnemannia gamsii]
MTMYLDFYEQSFEAAKGFDDDFDFCPSLSPTEASNTHSFLYSSAIEFLREIHKSRRTISMGANNGGWRHAQTHYHHHHHHHNQDKRRIPSSSLSYASYPYCSSSASESSSGSGASSPILSSSPSASPPLSPTAATPTSTSRAIAIVDPISGAPVQLPSSENLGTSGVVSSAPSSSATVTTTAGASSTVAAAAVGRGGGGGGGGYFSGLALPPPMMFHEPTLTMESLSSLSSSSMMPSSSPTSSDDFEAAVGMFDGGVSGFWMDLPTAQYLPYPPPSPQHLLPYPHSQDYSSFAPYPMHPQHHHQQQHQHAMGPAGGYVAVPMVMMGF